MKSQASPPPNVPPGRVDSALTPTTPLLDGRYAIGDELGRGGSAIVYRAVDAVTRAEVAVKVLRRELLDTAPSQRFLREVRLLTELRHPAIVPIIGAGLSDGEAGPPYYVMPVLGGGTLAKRLAVEGPLPVPEVLRIASDVAAALDFAHAYGVLHRDIKPQNILFDDRRVLVSDFGIARAVAQRAQDRLTESGVVVGTPAYMSPEQAGGDATIDGRTDVYALACVVYEMLAGEPPFHAPSGQAVIAKHRAEAVPKLEVVRPGLGDAVQRVLEKGLAKVPADRFATAGEFVHALVAALPTAWAGQPQRAPEQRRHGATMSIAAFAAVALVAAAIAGVRLSARRQSSGPAANLFDPRRVAVTYFTNLSGDDSTAFFADALTEALIDELSSVRSLRVISPAGVRPFRDHAITSDSVARYLHVGSIINGSVQRVHDTLRVAVRLVDGTTGQELYNEIIRQPRVGVAELQDSLVKNAAFALRQRLGDVIAVSAHRSSTKSSAAWEAAQDASLSFHDAVQANRRPGADAAGADLVLRADRLYARAENLDPNWAFPTLRRAGLAFTVSSWPDSIALPLDANVDAGPNRTRWLAWAQRLTDRALAKGADTAEVLSLRGGIAYDRAKLPGANGDSLLAEAERESRAAITLRPQLPAPWKTLADVYTTQGRSREAEDAAERAYAADAFFEVRETLSIGFLASLYTKQFDKAAAWCREGLARYPDDAQFAECKLRLMGWQAGKARGDIDRAWREVAQLDTGKLREILRPSRGFRRAMVAIVIARAGLRDSALHVIDDVRKAHDRDPTIILGRQEEAYVQILVGNADSAVALLKALTTKVPVAKSVVARNPWFETLHGMPGFDSAVGVRR